VCVCGWGKALLSIFTADSILEPGHCNYRLGLQLLFVHAVTKAHYADTMYARILPIYQICWHNALMLTDSFYAQMYASITWSRLYDSQHCLIW